MHIQSDAAGGFRYERALLQRVVDAVDGVFLHRQQETRAQLRTHRARVEQRRRGVREPSLGHEIVRLARGNRESRERANLDHRRQIAFVNADRDSHEHVLRSFHDLAVDLQEIRSFQCLESEVRVAEIAVVHNRRVEFLQ